MQSLNVDIIVRAACSSGILSSLQPVRPGYYQPCCLFVRDIVLSACSSGILSPVLPVRPGYYRSCSLFVRLCCPFVRDDKTGFHLRNIFILVSLKYINIINLLTPSTGWMASMNIWSKDSTLEGPSLLTHQFSTAGGLVTRRYSYAVLFTSYPNTVNFLRQKFETTPFVF